MLLEKGLQPEQIWVIMNAGWPVQEVGNAVTAAWGWSAPASMARFSTMPWPVGLQTEENDECGY